MRESAGLGVIYASAKSFSLAERGDPRTLGSFLCWACHKSYWTCMRNQNSGELRSAAESLREIAAEMPAWPLRTRERCARVTPRRDATSRMVISPKESYKTSPGWAGLKILSPPLLIVLIVDENHVYMHAIQSASGLGNGLPRRRMTYRESEKLEGLGERSV